MNGVGVFIENPNKCLLQRLWQAIQRCFNNKGNWQIDDAVKEWALLLMQAYHDGHIRMPDEITVHVIETLADVKRFCEACLIDLARAILTCTEPSEWASDETVIKCVNGLESAYKIVEEIERQQDAPHMTPSEFLARLRSGQQSVLCGGIGPHSSARQDALVIVEVAEKETAELKDAAYKKEYSALLAKMSSDQQKVLKDPALKAAFGKQRDALEAKRRRIAESGKNGKEKKKLWEAWSSEYRSLLDEEAAYIRAARRAIDDAYEPLFEELKRKYNRAT